MVNEYVILVDEQDNDIGVMEKMQAHQEGLLHRAFSVFIFNDKDELLLQQRALSKYHSAGLWTNTCCSHPRPNETIKDAANRRLFEEMGMSCVLKIRTNFINFLFFFITSIHKRPEGKTTFRTMNDCCLHRSCVVLIKVLKKFLLNPLPATKTITKNSFVTETKRNGNVK